MVTGQTAAIGAARGRTRHITATTQALASACTAIRRGGRQDQDAGGSEGGVSATGWP